MVKTEHCLIYVFESFSWLGVKLPPSNSTNNVARCRFEIRMSQISKHFDLWLTEVFWTKNHDRLPRPKRCVEGAVISCILGTSGGGIIMRHRPRLGPRMLPSHCIVVIRKGCHHPAWVGLVPSKSRSCLRVDTRWSWSWLGLGFGGLDYNSDCPLMGTILNESTVTELG